MADLIAPADWHGPPHERPGLFVRWARGEYPWDPDRPRSAEVVEARPTFELPAPTVLRSSVPEGLPSRGWPSIVDALTGLGWQTSVVGSTAWIMIDKTLGGRTVHVPSGLSASTLRISDQVRGLGAMALFLDGAYVSGRCWTVGPDGRPDDIPTKVGARCWHPRCWSTSPVGPCPCSHGSARQPRGDGWPWTTDHRGVDDTVRTPRPAVEFGRTDRRRNRR